MNSIRTCVLCKNKFEKEKLVRFVKGKGKINIDVKQILPGRGFYICIDDIKSFKNSKIKNVTGIDKENLHRLLYNALEDMVFMNLSSLKKEEKKIMCQEFEESRVKFYKMLKKKNCSCVNMKVIDNAIYKLDILDS